MHLVFSIIDLLQCLELFCTKYTASCRSKLFDECESGKILRWASVALMCGLHWCGVWCVPIHGRWKNTLHCFEGLEQGERDALIWSLMCTSARQTNEHLAVLSNCISLLREMTSTPTRQLFLICRYIMLQQWKHIKALFLIIALVLLKVVLTNFSHEAGGVEKYVCTEGIKLDITICVETLCNEGK